MSTQSESTLGDEFAILALSEKTFSHWRARTYHLWLSEKFPVNRWQLAWTPTGIGNWMMLTRWGNPLCLLLPKKGCRQDSNNRPPCRNQNTLCPMTVDCWSHAVPVQSQERTSWGTDWKEHGNTYLTSCIRHSARRESCHAYNFRDCTASVCLTGTGALGDWGRRGKDMTEHLNMSV